MASVVLENISKSFSSGKKVLDDLSLSVSQGEIFFLLGPSGCGKSTLLRILAGLVKQDSGRILFDGEEISALPPEKRQAAMVFQNYALWPHLSVFENVAFGLNILGVSGNKLKKEVMTVLELVQMEDFADRRVPSLSGGQQQRIALARALAVRPAVLLLDEPLSNLDARLRDTMRGEISRICRERQQTAIYVTHDRQEALSMADRMAVLQNGRISQLGTPKELYDHPADRFCGAFLGDINFIPGEISGNSICTAFGGFPLYGDIENASVAAIRPERIHFAGAGVDGFEAKIVSGVYLGDCTQWHCQANGVDLVVREISTVDRQAGSTVRLAFAEGFLLAMK